MQVQCRIEIAVVPDRSKSLVRPDVLGQLATEEIAQRSGGQARKEITRDDAEPIRGAELCQSLLNVRRGWTEKARKLSAGQGCQSFGRDTLGHLTKVGPFATLTDVPINRTTKCRNDVKKRGLG